MTQLWERTGLWWKCSDCGHRNYYLTDKCQDCKNVAGSSPAQQPNVVAGSSGCVVAAHVSGRAPDSGRQVATARTEHNHAWQTSAYQPDADTVRLWCNCNQLATQDKETGHIAERPGFLIVKPESGDSGSRRGDRGNEGGNRNNEICRGLARCVYSWRQRLWLCDVFEISSRGRPCGRSIQARTPRTTRLVVVIRRTQRKYRNPEYENIC